MGLGFGVVELEFRVTVRLHYGSGYGGADVSDGDFRKGINCILRRTVGALFTTSFLGDRV